MKTCLVKIYKDPLQIYCCFYCFYLFLTFPAGSNCLCVPWIHYHANVITKKSSDDVSTGHFESLVAPEQKVFSMKCVSPEVNTTPTSSNSALNHPPSTKIYLKTNNLKWNSWVRKERTKLTLKCQQQWKQPQYPQPELWGCHLVLLGLLRRHSGAQTSARPGGEWAATRTLRARTGSFWWNVVTTPNTDPSLACRYETPTEFFRSLKFPSVSQEESFPSQMESVKVLWKPGIFQHSHTCCFQSLVSTQKLDFRWNIELISSHCSFWIWSPVVWPRPPKAFWETSNMSSRVELNLL